MFEGVGEEYDDLDDAAATMDAPQSVRLSKDRWIEFKKDILLTDTDLQ